MPKPESFHESRGPGHPWRTRVRSTLLWWLGSVAVILLSSVARPSDAPAPLSPQDTRAAQKLYNTKCSKCHKFYNPEQYSDEDWKMWMEKMSKKSKLKPPQYDLLSRYLETLRKPAIPAHPGS